MRKIRVKLILYIIKYSYNKHRKKTECQLGSIQRMMVLQK